MYGVSSATASAYGSRLAVAAKLSHSVSAASRSPDRQLKRGYGIKVRVDGMAGSPRGYDTADFEDGFASFLPLLWIGVQL
jgi:hypothetical protein